MLTHVVKNKDLLNLNSCALGGAEESLIIEGIALSREYAGRCFSEGFIVGCDRLLEDPVCHR